MRALAVTMFTSLTLSTGLAAQQPAAAAAHAADPDRMVQGTGLPAGWNGRTDRGQPLTAAKFEAMGTGWHVTTGPAVILWRAADRANGAFHTLATFTQTKAPAHPEAYGMFVAGSALDSAAQSYIYVLVRGDGAYLIKRRVGTVVTTVVDWTPSAAVNKADSAGKATNKIELQNTDGHLTFTINGQRVHSMDIPVAETAGMVGLRVNHNLDVHVEGFAVHQIGR
ncbi:MAG TPA: hypothetical protein VG940_06040 [Gemmatimonadales bacterium]|nr:hypothetical protein [Gemmatimonadales bacterium]